MESAGSAICKGFDHATEIQRYAYNVKHSFGQFVSVRAERKNQPLMDTDERRKK